MALRIANNVSALNAQRNLNKTQNMLQGALERLSSGLRINKAADDTAGLSISQNFRADIASFKVASSNASEATAMLQTAEGGMNQIHAMLTRLKELATQAASDNVKGTRSDINTEAGELISEIDRIAKGTRYADSSLLDGYGKVGETSDLDTVSDIYDVNVENADAATWTASTMGGGDMTYATGTNELTLATGGVSQTVKLTQGGTADFTSFGISFKLTEAAVVDDVGTAIAGTATGNGQDIAITTPGSGGTFQIGAKNDSNTDQLTLSIDSVTKSDLSLGSVNLESLSGAQDAMTTIDSAISQVSTSRGEIGANQNRLGYASANLATSLENATAAESVIRDADIAQEMMQFTKAQILQQAGTAMLAQANALPQAALALLG